MLQDHGHGASPSHGTSVYFPADAGTHLTDPKGWKAGWPITYPDGLPAQRRSSVLVVTKPDID